MVNNGKIKILKNPEPRFLRFDGILGISVTEFGGILRNLEDSARSGKIKRTYKIVAGPVPQNF